MTPEEQRQPLTPAKVEAGIRDAINRLQVLTGEYARAGDAKAEAEAAYRIAYATARQNYRERAVVDGLRATDSIVDDVGVLATQDQLRERLSTAAVEEATKLALRSCQSRLDALRSLGTSLRESTGG